jgi:hypothetical protein
MIPHSTMTSNPPQSPSIHHQPTVVADTPIHDLLWLMQEDPGDEQVQKKWKLIHLTSEQFSVFIQCFPQQQKDFGLLLQHQPTLSDPSISNKSQTNTRISIDHHPFSTIAKAPEYYNNEKYEDSICKPLQPPYDGSADQLIPFLNPLDICHQDEGWYPITFLHTNDGPLDIIWDFSKVSKQTIMAAHNYNGHPKPKNKINLSFSHFQIMIPFNSRNIYDIQFSWWKLLAMRDCHANHEILVGTHFSRPVKRFLNAQWKSLLDFSFSFR